MLIVDSHQDLAWNMLTFGRDYTLSAATTRHRESGTLVPVYNDDALLGWPDYQRGRVAVVFATLYAAPQRWQAGAWDTQCYDDLRAANRLYRTQLDRYHRLADDHPDKFRLIYAQNDLQEVLAAWDRQQEQLNQAAGASEDGEKISAPAVDGPPVGLVILMEGAEGVRAPAELEEWWQGGVRLVGPAWAGTRFCGGTREPGKLTKEGFELLEAMAGIGFSLDLSHMDEPAALQAIDAYPGPIVASHSNALALLKGADSNRHLPDPVIHGLLERGGVIGVVPYNAFLRPGWKRGDRREGITLHHLVAHIDYICQMAGDAWHVGIGSDFDGGFGLQSTPEGIDTVADLQKIAPLLQEKGYTEADIAAILGQNWLRWLRSTLPERV